MNAANPFRVIVVDDQPAIRKDVKMLLSPYPEFTLVGSYSSVKEALVGIPLNKPNVLLLDISLGDGTGFDLLDRLLQKDFKVIFLTAYEEYALRAIQIGALDYLVKPLNEADFRRALLRVIELQHIIQHAQASYKARYTDGPRRIVLPADDQLQQVVDINTIMYCQSDAGYTTFFLANGKKITTSKYIKEYEEYFSSDRFIRTHQSYVVNVDFIGGYHKDGYLVLKNGNQIPVATRRKEIVINALPGT